jgi:hypothetical protein
LFELRALSNNLLESPSTASYRIMTRVSLTNYRIPALSLRWLYVDFNSYFASIEQQLRRELRVKLSHISGPYIASQCYRGFRRETETRRANL